MTPSRSRERERPCVPVHGVQVLRGELSMGERACRRVAWPLVHAELSHAHHFRRARLPLLILHQVASSPRRSRGIPPTPFHLLRPASRVLRHLLSVLCSGTGRCREPLTGNEFRSAPACRSGWMRHKIQHRAASRFGTRRKELCSGTSGILRRKQAASVHSAASVRAKFSPSWPAPSRTAVLLAVHPLRS